MSSRAHGKMHQVSVTATKNGSGEVKFEPDSKVWNHSDGEFVFRKDEHGRFLWPGFGENSRVLEWIFRRCQGTGEARETPIGFVPAAGAIVTDGLDVDPHDMERLLAVDSGEWKLELPAIHQHFARFGEQLPQALRDQLSALERRLGGDD